MAKTQPVGVRFREDVIEILNKKYGIKVPQKVLIFLESFFLDHSLPEQEKTEIKIKLNKKTELPAYSNPMTIEDSFPVKKSTTQSEPIYDLYSNIESRLLSCDDVEQFYIITSEITNATFSFLQKQRLRDTANKIFQQKFNF